MADPTSYDVHDPLTKQSWQRYLDDAGEGAFCGYIDAHTHYLKTLQAMLANSKTMKELKSELTNFVQDREAWDKDVEQKWVSQNPVLNPL